MRITIDTPVNELIHSVDIQYIDLDENELVHWKYIKREKLSNGKYRYYYDVKQLKDDLGFDERERYKTAERMYKRSAERADQTFDNWMDFYKTYDYKSKEQRDRNNELRIAAKAARETYNDFSKKYNKAWNDYMNTPLGELSKLTKPIERGAKAISNFFSKIFKKKR